jgi:hypothetical protein
LTQSHGGPCGILAPIQGFVLVDLLFKEHKLTSDYKQAALPIPTDAQRNAALVRSIVQTLARARTDSNSPFYIVEHHGSTLFATTFGSQESTAAFYHSKPELLTSSTGVLNYVYSLLLTRGLRQVKDDMDDCELNLVARFGHCSQELVNLVLCGAAVTNVFDGRKDMEGLIIRGVEARNQIGFLTLLEAMRHSKVGENYKSPEFPVWVIGSASHYTVLFAIDPAVGKVSTTDRADVDAKAAFDRLDPHECGFVADTQLSALLDLLGACAAARNNIGKVRDLLVQDGIVLWENVRISLPFLITGAEGKSNEASIPRHMPGAWNCPSCTFLNYSQDLTACEVCETNRPAPAAAASTPNECRESGHPTPFQLWHFNGISNHANAVATCTRVVVLFLCCVVQLSCNSTVVQSLLIGC